MTLSDAELAAVSNAYMVADEYAHRPAGRHRQALAALARTTTRFDLLEAAAIRHAIGRRWESFDAVTLLVGAGADPGRVYTTAWAV